VKLQQIAGRHSTKEQMHSWNYEGF